MVLSRLEQQPSTSLVVLTILMVGLIKSKSFQKFTTAEASSFGVDPRTTNMKPSLFIFGTQTVNQRQGMMISALSSSSSLRFHRQRELDFKNKEKPFFPSNDNNNYFDNEKQEDDDSFSNVQNPFTNKGVKSSSAVPKSSSSPSPSYNKNNTRKKQTALYAYNTNHDKNNDKQRFASSRLFYKDENKENHEFSVADFLQEQKKSDEKHVEKSSSSSPLFNTVASTSYKTTISANAAVAVPVPDNDNDAIEFLVVFIMWVMRIMQMVMDVIGKPILSNIVSWDSILKTIPDIDFLQIMHTNTKINNVDERPDQGNVVLAATAATKQEKKNHVTTASMCPSQIIPNDSTDASTKSAPLPMNTAVEEQETKKTNVQQNNVVNDLEIDDDDDDDYSVAVKIENHKLRVAKMNSNTPRTADDDISSDSFKEESAIVSSIEFGESTSRIEIEHMMDIVVENDSSALQFEVEMNGVVEKQSDKPEPTHSGNNILVDSPPRKYIPTAGDAVNITHQKVSSPHPDHYFLDVLDQTHARISLLLEEIDESTPQIHDMLTMLEIQDSFPSLLSENVVQPDNKNRQISNARAPRASSTSEISVQDNEDERVIPKMKRQPVKNVVTKKQKTATSLTKNPSKAVAEPNFFIQMNNNHERLIQDEASGQLRRTKPRKMKKEKEEVTRTTPFPPVEEPTFFMQMNNHKM